MCHDPAACDEAIAYWDALYAADAREQQAQREREERRDMMSDEQLAEIKERAPYAAYESGYQAPQELSRSNAYHDIQNLLAEVERLRAREAALVEIVRAVAFDDPIQPDSGNFVCYYCCASSPYESAVTHGEHCTYEQARALLASADEAK